MKNKWIDREKRARAYMHTQSAIIVSPPSEWNGARRSETKWKKIPEIDKMATTKTMKK